MVVVAFGGALDLGLKAKMSELGLRRACRADINMLYKTSSPWPWSACSRILHRVTRLGDLPPQLAHRLSHSSGRPRDPLPFRRQSLGRSYTKIANLNLRKTRVGISQSCGVRTWTVQIPPLYSGFSIWRRSEKVLHVRSSPSLEIISATNLEDGSEESDSGSASPHSKL